MATTKRPSKLKKVAYRFIEPGSEHGQPMYALLRELVGADHRELTNARIALAWNVLWQANLDGQIKNGECKKASDLDREIGGEEPFDFVIILRREFWQEQLVEDRRRRALLDSMLCHCAVQRDANGEPVIDERGRTAYRLRDYDLKGFTSNIERHGIWSKNQEEFFRAIQRSRNRVKGRFIAYTTLYEHLVRVGIPIPIELIATWSDVERREAAVWADLKSTGQLEALPAFLERYKQPVQDVLPPIPPSGFPDRVEAPKTAPVTNT